MISDADQVLADLQKWKEEREHKLKEFQKRKEKDEEELNKLEYGQENQDKYDLLDQGDDQNLLDVR